MKREVAELRKRAINSLVLAIELFNRPHESGRSEAVLILLHHAFEMLLKSTIRDRTGTVHGKGQRYTYSFDKCLDLTKNQLKLISVDERTTLSILDAHRDLATHFFQDISEDFLYLQAQASVTLFDELLNRAYGQKLADIIPSRVLPISSRPPKDLHILVDSELRQVDELLKVGTKKGARAAAKMRPILALATATRDKAERVSELELRRVLAQRRRGEEWSVVLPEIAQLRLDSEGDGIPLYLKIKKDAKLAVRVAKPGDRVVGTVIKQQYDWFDKYNLSITDIAKKLGLTIPKTRAYMFEINVWQDREMYGEKQVGTQAYKRYTKKALDALRAIKERTGVVEVWNRHKKSVLGRKSVSGS